MTTKRNLKEEYSEEKPEAKLEADPVSELEAEPEEKLEVELEEENEIEGEPEEEHSKQRCHKCLEICEHTFTKTPDDRGGYVTDLVCSNCGFITTQ